MKKLTSLFVVLIVALGALAQNSDEPQMVKPTERVTRHTYPIGVGYEGLVGSPVRIKFRDGSEKQGYLRSGLFDAQMSIIAGRRIAKTKFLTNPATSSI